MFPSNALFVTETGLPVYDSLTVEHNGLLAERGLDAAVVRETLSGLVKLSVPWDELFISGVDREHAADYIEGARAAQVHGMITMEKPYHFVDCGTVRDSGGDYLAALSRNARYQVRRAVRAYEERGPIRFQVAGTLEQAQEYFENLVSLHQQYWEVKGMSGAFGSKFSHDFHNHLICTRFEMGEIQLAELRVGTMALGYLYNFVLDRVVYNYQSAFRYDEDSKLKPGLVSHCYAVQYNVQTGMKAYDLLMGTQRYKQSLATHRREMVWLVVQKPKIRFRLEQALVGLRQRLRGAYRTVSAESTQESVEE
jgi:hypothetical protein